MTTLGGNLRKNFLTPLGEKLRRIDYAGWEPAQELIPLGEKLRRIDYAGWEPESH